MTNRLFYQPSPDEVAHTSFSAVLVKDSATRLRIENDCEEFFPTSSNFVGSYEKWGGDEEPEHTAFNLTNKTDLPFFEYLAQSGFEERGERMARAMQGSHTSPAFDMKHTVQGYDWASAKGTIVDVGGSMGAAALALARAHPHLPKIIVQDLPNTVSQAETSLPPEVHKQIYFHPHDFFTPQPETITTARLFLMRQVLHDYSDKYARRILRNLIPALRTGAKLVVVDGILSAPGIGPPTVEKQMRNLDMDMMQMTNGRERQIEEWEDLFRSVDGKLIIRNVNQPVGSALGVMEVVWDS